MAWFDAEYDVLLATVDVAMDWGWHPLVWQISWVSTPFLAVRGRSLEWSAIKRVTMAAGNRDEAAIAAGGARDAVGTLGDYQYVLDYFANSRKLYQQLGGRRGEALALYGLASIAEYLGQYGQALNHAEEAAGLFHDLGDQVGEAELLNSLAGITRFLGTTSRRADYVGRRSPSTPAMAAATWRATSGTAWGTPNTMLATSPRQPPAPNARCASSGPSATAGVKSIP